MDVAELRLRELLACRRHHLVPTGAVCRGREIPVIARVQQRWLGACWPGRMRATTLPKMVASFAGIGW
jgi:hypothetical protein